MIKQVVLYPPGLPKPVAGGSFARRKGSVTPPELNDLRVVNAIPAHIWRSAPDGAVQFVNQQWMDYTGLSQENSQGWGWVSVIHRGSAGTARRVAGPHQVAFRDPMWRPTFC